MKDGDTALWWGAQPIEPDTYSVIGKRRKLLCQTVRLNELWAQYPWDELPPVVRFRLTHLSLKEPTP